MEPLEQGLRQTRDVAEGDALVIPLPEVDAHPGPIVSWFDAQSSVQGSTPRTYVTIDRALVLLERNPR